MTIHAEQDLAAAPPADPLQSRALKAQGELLPYALGFFAVALPVFVWAASYADDAVWMSLIFAQFSLNWAGFYLAVNRFGPKNATPAGPSGAAPRAWRSWGRSGSRRGRSRPS